MEAIRVAIYTILEKGQPMTVRQLYYALTVAGAIEKTEAEYKAVKRLTAEMRRSGAVPYAWLADATRWMRKPTTFSGPEEALKRTAATYRRALWDDALVRPEVWIEKDALAGVLVDVTAEWDCPLMVTRGYPSMSFQHSAAVAAKARGERGQRTRIYYFGDHDPSGVDIDRAIVEGIGESLEALEGFGPGGPYGVERTFADYADFVRVGVTPEQIDSLALPTRPTKKSDTRSKGFAGASVELDSIPPDTLRQLARDAIEHHVDQRSLQVLRRVELEERRGLEAMAASFEGARP